MAIDVQKKLLFVSNWGNASDYKVAGSGKFYPPSITVYPLDASGDTLRCAPFKVPRRSWTGPQPWLWTRTAGYVFMANDLGDSVIAFRETDDGDVAPSRIIKGGKTGLKNPTGVAVDSKNKELWVSNLGNSSACALSADGEWRCGAAAHDPQRAGGRTSVKFGKPQAVAYDSKREEYLVPN